ncbi:MAG: hypothetical protein JRH20_20950 [Deltaproteobacteria bacterium]|nr:hypothetical protein [Deltaproteobacteria bacterium]
MERKAPPELGARYAEHDIVHTLFVPQTPERVDGIWVVAGEDLLGLR